MHDKMNRGAPTVMTALALSSVKSRPSLTLPRHTANNSAPVIDWTLESTQKE